jgi:hypothetical protein
MGRIGEFMFHCSRRANGMRGRGASVRDRRGDWGSAARSYLPQHLLNFLPEPHGQRSFRPRFLVLRVAPRVSFGWRQ